MDHIKTFGVVADTTCGNKEGRACGFEGTVGLLRGSTTTARIWYIVSSSIAYKPWLAHSRRSLFVLFGSLYNCRKAL